MIYGIGIDIQSIEQLDGIFERQKDRFLRKVFTPAERAYCEQHRLPAQHYAARWAVKEAFFKALGTGLTGGYRLTDVETVRLASGKPHVLLYGKALDDCARLGLRVLVSLSHSADYACAQVLLCAREEDEN